MTGAFRVEPSEIVQGYPWHVVRLSDGCIVGFHMTRERAQAFADRGGEPEPVEITIRPVEHDGQIELFGGGD